MNSTCRLAIVAALAACPIRLEAQQITVQQPQQQVFSVDTVVSVPDRGNALLGGVGSAATGRNSAFGVPGNRGAGRASSAGSARSHVVIHDFEAMDAELLGRPAPRGEYEEAIRLRFPNGIGALTSPEVRPVGTEGTRTAEAIAGLRRYRRHVAAYGVTGAAESASGRSLAAW